MWIWDPCGLRRKMEELERKGRVWSSQRIQNHKEAFTMGSCKMLTLHSEMGLCYGTVNCWVSIWFAVQTPEKCENLLFQESLLPDSIAHLSSPLITSLTGTYYLYWNKMKYFYQTKMMLLAQEWGVLFSIWRDFAYSFFLFVTQVHTCKNAG